MKTADEIEHILANVRERLTTSAHAARLGLHVPPEGYVQHDDWLTIVVTPQEQTVRALDYLDALSEVEKGMRADGIKHIILVPAIEE